MIFILNKQSVFTLLAMSTHGIGLISGNLTLLSKSFFSSVAPSNVEPLDTSNRIKQPTAIAPYRLRRAVFLVDLSPTIKILKQYLDSEKRYFSFV